MKIRNLLRFQESNLAEDIFVIARQSIVSISLVIENPNKASSWCVLPADDDFPNYLGVAEGSESCLEDDSGSEHGDEDDSPLVGKLVFRNVTVKTYIRLSKAVGEQRTFFWFAAV